MYPLAGLSVKQAVGELLTHVSTCTCTVYIIPSFLLLLIKFLASLQDTGYVLFKRVPFDDLRVVQEEVHVVVVVVVGKDCMACESADVRVCACIIVIKLHVCLSGCPLSFFHENVIKLWYLL